MGFRGKIVANDHYFHLSTLDQIDDEQLILLVRKALDRLNSNGVEVNIAKFNDRTKALSLLSYPNFDTEPFPSLASSWTFSDSYAGTPVFRNYQSSLNPPILHRKELLVSSDYPSRKAWESLTTEAESLGLFDEPTTIGFRLNWEKLIRSKGYTCIDHSFVPIGNASDYSDNNFQKFDRLAENVTVQRHLTALSRGTLSAPVQLLIRHNLLTKEVRFFDYGCGKGDDIASLLDEGFNAAGWDPHFAPDLTLINSEVTNLGFVVNVIEDPAERVEAITKAFALTQGVLAVSVMLYSSAYGGVNFRDGVLNSRQTFQKYFTQSEIKDFIEQVLQRNVYMAGPGVAFVFANEEWEQRFNTTKFQTRGIASRLLQVENWKRREYKLTRARIPRPPKISSAELKFNESKEFLDKLWSLTLDLGRWPDPEETCEIGPLPKSCRTLMSAIRMIENHYNLELLKDASNTRKNDLRVFFAAQQFQKIPAYKKLSSRLQLDIKAFFGDYRLAQMSAIQLLKDTSDPAKIYDACKIASEQGFGWLENEHSLQLHVDLVERLPAILRTYITCGLILWDSLGEVDLIKIHIRSGKLTLLELDEFDQTPLPLMRRRVKINLHKLDYDVFDYGSTEFPKPFLFFKSRYLHEDLPGYAAQKAFDDKIESEGLITEGMQLPDPENFELSLKLGRFSIKDMKLLRSTTIPDLDQKCGTNFTYRSFIECGSTQHSLGLQNLPKSPQTYNALRDLAAHIIDPLIDYYGGIKLTYGFCSHELGKHIVSSVAHHLDQHASYERNLANKLICSRGGAACDFIVEYEDMEEVANWIIENLQFDRLYFYGNQRPLHVSYSENGERKAYRMTKTESGRLMPRPYKTKAKTTHLE